MFRARFVVLTFAVAAALFGQSTGERLDLKQLIEIALERNPEILAAQKRYEAAAQRPRAAGALPDPMVSLGYNASGYPLPGAGLGTEPVANIGATLTQEFPYPGKRGLRAKISGKEAQAEWENYLATRLDVIARLKQAYFALQHTYAMEDVLARNREILDRMLNVVESRYSVGKALQQDIFKAQTQISIIETRRIQLARDRRTAEAAIDTLLNRPLDTPVLRPPEPVMNEMLPPVNEILAYARDNAPAIAREQRGIERGELAVRLAHKNFYPDFALSGGYYNMGSMPPMYMVRADVKLPIWSRRQRAELTEQANTLSESRRRYEATQNNLEYQINEDYLMAESSLKLMNIYMSTVIPQSNLALESALSSYQAGTADFVGVLSNFMTSVEYEMNYHQEMQSFHTALAQLEALSAMPLIHVEAK